MKFNIDERLRDYQRDGIQSLREGIKDHHRTQLLCAPTGSGKGEIAVALMAYAERAGSRAAIILDRIVLCNQMSERLDLYGIPHGVTQSGHWRHKPSERIQVCSAQTIEKRGAFPGLSLMVVDEAHQIRSQTKEFIRNNPSVKVVGLTATPFTKGLGNTFSRVVNTVTTEELVDAGTLAPLRVFVAKQIDMTGAKKVAGEWTDADAAERGIKISGDIVAEWVAKTNEIFGGPKKTVVFCASVDHGADLALKFGEAGFNFVTVSYKDTDEFKQEAFKEFAKPDSSIHGLIAVDILTKGFDCSDVFVGVSARPFSKSLSSHVQQMGRVMRSHPSKSFALWLCHSGNYLRFKDEWDDIYSNGPGELDDGREKPQVEPTDQEKEASKCPKCGALWGNSDMCPHCGFVRQRLNLVKVSAAEMEEVATKSAAARAERQSFYSQLQAIAQMRGHKPGWAFYKYKEKFHMEPIGLHTFPSEPTAQVVRWVQSRNIAWAKGRKSA